MSTEAGHVTGRHHTDPKRGDTSDDDLDQQFRALLEGLRTTLPGSQVLLGFLLVLPFQTTFVDLSGRNTALYVTAFFASAMASVLLIAPSVHQRVRAPVSGIKRTDATHVAAAVRVALVGTGFLGLAITASTLLVAVAVDAGPAPMVGVVAVVAAIIYTWLIQPLFVFRNRQGGEGRDHDR